jgi:hypothetical protein
MNSKTRVMLGLLLCAASAFYARAEDLYVPDQFATIQAAIAQARLDRLSPGLSPNETIVIHVAAGLYAETLPLTLDVPNLRLQGATSLNIDGDGLPTSFVGSTETRIVAQPPLTETQTILLLGPTSKKLTGTGVTIQGLVLDAGNKSKAGGRDIIIDRVSGFMIRDNVLTGSAMLGVDGRASSGTIEGNLITGVGCGICIGAGNRQSPAFYTFQKNRSVGNAQGGLLVGGSDYDGVLYPQLLPVAPGTSFDSVTAVIKENDLSDNNKDTSFSFGIRLMAFIPNTPATQSESNITVFATDNRITNNTVGITIDAGFPWRSDARLWTTSLSATFAGNTISFSKLTPALISFTRNEAAEFPKKELQFWKYLQDSTITITDPTADLSGYWFDHPATDPIDGRILNNSLTVNGSTIPNGRNFK